MPRLVLVAALVSALAVVPTLAQRGGIHGGFAGHGGFGGHGSFGGHVRGGASFGGMRERSGFRNPGFRRPALRGSGGRNPAFARRRFSQDHFLHNRRFQGSRFHRFDHDRDDFRFARPTLLLPLEFVNPSSWRSPKGAGTPLSPHKIRELWTTVRKQVVDAECLIGVHFPTPREDKGATSEQP